MFAGLPISRATAAMAFGTLVTVGIMAGIYPAARAAHMTPVEALRHR
jgi:ABC-type lipoprotein release transport system permease subunit